MKRGVFALFTFLLAVAVAVTAGVLWVVHTEHGLRFAVGQAQDWMNENSDQQLEFGKVQGTLSQGLDLEFVRWKQADTTVEIEQIQLVIDWSNVLNRMVRISNLSAQVVRVDSPPSEEDSPLVIPDEISVPVDVDLRHLSVQQLLINGEELTQLSARGSVQSKQLNIDNFSLNVRDTQINSSLEMALAKPYQMRGAVNAQRKLDDLLLNAQLAATGSIERLALALDAKGENPGKADQTQRVQANAVLTLLGSTPFETVRLNAENFDPSNWLDGAPRASLAIVATVEPNADFSESTGNFSVRNARPSTVQSGGLPLSFMRARFNLNLREQLPEQFDLWVDELQLADGKRQAGNANASIQWRASKQSDDQIATLDVLAGDVNFDVKTNNLDASVFASLPQQLALTSTIQGTKNGQQLQVKRLSVRDRQAELQGKLRVDLRGKVPVDVQLDLKGINPANYVPDASPLLQGDLNGKASFNGVLVQSGKAGAVDPLGEINLDLMNSRLANAPLTLVAKATGGVSRLSNMLLDLDVVGNTVKATGSYGTQSDFVDVDVNLDELARLGKLIQMKLSGTARLKGKLRGIDGNFSGEGNVDVRQLKLDDTIQIDTVSGQFNLGSAPNSPWVGDIVASKVKVPGAVTNTLNELKLTLRGVRNQHELRGEFASGLQPFSRLRALKGEFAFAGGVGALRTPKNVSGWKGQWTQLKIEGMWLPARSFALQAPAPLTIAPGYFELTNFVLKGEDTSVLNNKVLRIANREIRVEGEMPQFYFPRMSPILRKQLTVEPKDLIAKVKWNYLANPNKVDGHVDVQHVSGGLQVLEDSQVDVDIRTMTANLDFNREAASVDLNILADDFGAVTANLKLPVQQNPQTKAWEIAGNEAMQGSVAAGFTELNWLGPMISGGVRTSGTGQIAMAIAGTANNPDVQGRLFALDLDVFQLDQGVRFEDGNVVVDFTTDKASIDTFEFTVYNRRSPRRYLEELGPLIQGNGKVKAEGVWNLTGLNGEIRLSMDRVPLLQRLDRWMMVNSSVTLQQPSVDGQPLKIRGEVDTLGAYFEMPESGPQTLGDDVFIQGRSELAGQGLPIDLQLRANLGDRFYVNAEGLRSRLEGGLRLVMLEGVGGSGQRRSGRRLSATGTIQTVSGTYRAYGQDLSIERGVVNFQGPLDNPGLNVRAVRKGVAVEAGVEVTGTAQRPTVSLVSEPAVPDSEKLSWMILGRGSGSADRDSTLLLTAAAAIFGDEDESTTRKIAKSIGIDDLSLSTGSLTAADSRAVGSKVAIAPGADASANVIGSDDPLLSQRIVSLGKRFSDRVYLSFDQSVTTAASILKLNYQYSRKLSFIARAGADNAVDVLYQFSFD
ncbi:translocation/assembly module TamB domain-containing protein [uncultured Limnobacter sp.]|uniref:translocation/assembly module TamB domain-containing protein n=1 Tax=uncultured Limnobacter sp. TaxID=199681 RepID=UPI0025D8E37D|nr:translocation/assembly module TamB domain-containing protein [uncultured Limnobacter sp.]